MSLRILTLVGYILCISGFYPFKNHIRINNLNNIVKFDKKYPLSFPHYIKNHQNQNQNSTRNEENKPVINMKEIMNRKYPLSIRHYENYVKRLNSRNPNRQNRGILGQNQDSNSELDSNSDLEYDLDEEAANSAFEKNLLELFKNNTRRHNSDEDDEDENDEDDPYSDNNKNKRNRNGFRLIINKNIFDALNTEMNGENDNTDNDNDNNYDNSRGFNNNNNYDDDDDDGSNKFKHKDMKSKNFEVLTKFPLKFKDVGGYDKIKFELKQCIEILSNYTKYSGYNVRIPKGLILEGPPGNGKTMLAKALAGEAKVGFIPVSGSEFQEQYVGVGSSRVRELFQLAKKNIPCIIFIDEIDAIGRHRSNDGESSSSERDNTLNELLVALDGFKNSTGIFLIGATNRVDLLDPALLRPGRIDKKIYIGNPDSDTREAILNIHSKGKPYDNTVNISDLVDLTMGLSGAQIENLLNEAMLNALRYDRTKMTSEDIDSIINRIIAGWQPTDHQFTTDIIDHIAIHEMGHAITGALSKHHSKVTKVVINLSSPNSPGYTVFEGTTSTIYTREALFEHLIILLAGRIAEEVFYGVSVTTGAINDFEEAFKLAEKMIIYYGMGKKVIYPSSSEKYKQLIDDDVADLIQEAYQCSETIIKETMDILLEGAEILKRDKILKAEQLHRLITTKYVDMENI